MNNQQQKPKTITNTTNNKLPTTNQPTNQPTNQLTNQPTNIPIYQPAKKINKPKTSKTKQNKNTRVLPSTI